MAAIKLRLMASKVIQNYHIKNTCSAVQKLLYCTKNSNNEETPTSGKSGFAKFSEKQEEFLTPPSEKNKPEPKSFAALLRNSHFVDLGDPEGKQVIGTIYHVVENDLYIDFGWKFPTVCKRPERNQTLYVPGAKVRLLIKDLELSSTFLGLNREITLLEADCILLGLAKKDFLVRIQNPNEV